MVEDEDSGDLGTPAGIGRRGERAEKFQVGNGQHCQGQG